MHGLHVQLGGPSGLLQRQIESVRQMLNFNESGSAGSQGIGGADPQWKVLVYDQVTFFKQLSSPNIHFFIHNKYWFWDSVHNKYIKTNTEIWNWIIISDQLCF